MLMASSRKRDGKKGATSLPPKLFAKR